jgi:hypothetical protein
MTNTIPCLLPRPTSSYKCTCGGYCEPVECSQQEEKEFGCGTVGFVFVVKDMLVN